MAWKDKSCILEITNDEFELIVNIYETTRDMARDLGITRACAQSRLHRIPKKAKTRYIRLFFEEE